jgi:hypothetical protein
MAFSIFALTGCDLSPRGEHGPRITSYGHLYEVGLAIQNYKERNGELPQHLSNLVPTYIPTNHIAIFYVINESAKQQVLPPDWEGNPKEIDRFSSYVYLGTNGMAGVIAYEKTNLWKSTATYPDKVAVLFSDFHVQYVPITELKNHFH